MKAARSFVSAVVLAAGRGARMGRTKQLLPFEGRPLLAGVIETALASAADEVVVVLGHDAEAIRAAVGGASDGARFVVNPNYDEGQATSLIAGLEALDRRADAAVVLLGDQPGVTPADVDAVVSAYLASGAPAARALYESGEAGHPVVIGRVLWDEVCAQRGDVGAREVLRRHADRVLSVALDKPAPRDVDSPADYEAALAPRRR